MEAQEVAQSVPEKFYYGPDSIVAPHLPIGSPERAELFDRLRETFVEDWKAAELAVAREIEEAKGDLYFIRCDHAVKIGHTRNIANRLGNMQVNSPHEIDCLLLLKGRGRDEKKWHRRFAGARIRGEWFRLTPELEAAIHEARAEQMTHLPPIAG